MTCHGWYKSIYGKDYQPTTTSEPPINTPSQITDDENSFSKNDNEYYGQSSENSLESGEFYQTVDVQTSKPSTVVFKWPEPSRKTSLPTTVKTEITKKTTQLFTTTITSTLSTTTTTTTTTTISSTTKKTSLSTSSSPTTFTTTTRSTFTTQKVESTSTITQTSADVEEEVNDDDNDDENYDEEDDDEEVTQEPKKPHVSNTHKSTVTTTGTSSISSKLISTPKEDIKILNKYTTIFSSNLLEKLRNFESNENRGNSKNFTILTSNGKKTVLIPVASAAPSSSVLLHSNESLANKLNHFASANQTGTSVVGQVEIIKNIFSFNNRTVQPQEHQPIPVVHLITPILRPETSSSPNQISQFLEEDQGQAEEGEEVETLAEKEDLSMMDSDLLLNLQLNTNSINKENNSQKPRIEVENESNDYSDQSQAIYSESASSTPAFKAFYIFIYSFLCIQFFIIY